MKFFKKLAGTEEKKPQWDIKPTGEKPAPRKNTAAEEPPPSEVKREKNPFLDDAHLDTMSLQADDLAMEDPYQTNSWEQAFENDTRKMKSIQIDKGGKGADGNDYNPYDTGSLKRGWKK